MKTSQTVLVITLIFGITSWALEANRSEISHAACLSQADVIWYQNLSKSGIARTCNQAILQRNLDREGK